MIVYELEKHKYLTVKRIHVVRFYFCDEAFVMQKIRAASLQESVHYTEFIREPSALDTLTSQQESSIEDINHFAQSIYIDKSISSQGLCS